MSRRDSLAIVGAAVDRVTGLDRGKIDEIAFAVTRRALKQAGVRAQDVDVSVLSSSDLYDGRGISNGIVSPAAAGYLDNELRLELDASAAIVTAAASLRARQAELGVVVAISCPEIEVTDTDGLRQFTDQVSNLTFDPHVARPLGLTSTAALAMHAAAAVDRGETTREALAARAAEDISRGAAAGRTTRPPVSAQDVLDSPLIAWPLTELMLPAESMAAVALVIGTEPRARRARQIHAWLSGWASATTSALDDSRWIDDPWATTRDAVERAYAMAEVNDPSADVDMVELTSLTPAMRDAGLDALGLANLAADQVNASGGPTADFPGLANGAARVVDAIEQLEQADRHASGRPRRAVVHAMDNVMGTISSTATILVLEQPS